MGGRKWLGENHKFYADPIEDKLILWKQDFDQETIGGITKQARQEVLYKDNNGPGYVLEVFSHNTIRSDMVHISHEMIEALRKIFMREQLQDKAESWQEESYCSECQEDLPHQHYTTGHERDSSQDTKTCLVCGLITHSL